MTPIRHHHRMGLTYQQIADKYGRSVSTIKQTWRKHPDWPSPTNTGKTLEFDEDAIHALATRVFLPPPPPEGDPDELLTLTEIATKINQPVSTLQGYAHRKGSTHWPKPAGHRNGTTLWRWQDVADHLAGRRRKPVGS